ncbi:hypothetical protein MNBD_GAMMA10-2234 [hydrothermal vent metagenome]|uniref:Uncharacterized protein n=1 Tax=hydrothermal vent metagenome TaxID=652676 RepID=A0A3B0YAV5_9ZZZZ
MEHKTTKIEFTESNARYTLLALRDLNEKLYSLAHNESIDEDERFFHANDLMESSRAYEKMEKKFIEIFGDNILKHNYDVL